MKKKWIGIIVVAVAVFVVLWWNPFSAGDSQINISDLSIAPVIRDTMTIDVVESGNLESSDSLVIKSQVEGRATIIFIVPEGTTITDEDVEQGSILVELDSADLRERESQQSITVQSAYASLADASASFEIQIKQNESNLKSGEQNQKFGLMDLEKYLGRQLAGAFVEGRVSIDQMLESESLGGGALQRKRDLEIAIDTNREEKFIAEETLTWTNKLYEEGYVTRNDKQRDELTLQRRVMALEKSQTELELFLQFDFRKEAEKLLANYLEAIRELDRIKARNQAELSKAEARLASNQATYGRQIDQLDKIRAQIENCTIRATRPGLVVYAGSDNFRGGDPIQEGTEIRERQEIIKIPNTATMRVTTKIHESVISRVRPGQEAQIIVDAIPNRVFHGSVKQVAILPETQSRWLNPNLKVYPTEIDLEGDQGGIRPGMSAQVRILVESIPDVLQVPIQAVTYSAHDSVCFAVLNNKPEVRVVQTGEYNDEFIQILSGLNENENVVLNPERLRSRFNLDERTRTIAPGPEGIPDEETRSEEGQQQRPQTEGEEQPTPDGERRRPGQGRNLTLGEQGGNRQQGSGSGG
jgi:HlyD family secretion protein